MIKAYKYAIKPGKQQAEKLQVQFDSCRYIFNRSLALKSYAYKKFKLKLGLKELKGRLPKLKSRFPWLKNADSQAFQQSVINLDTAFKNFFNGRAKYPRFKSKRDKQSIQYPQRVVVNSETQQVYLPKVGWVDIILHRELGAGKIKTVTVSKTNTGKYFASILIDDGLAAIDPVKLVHADKVLGIDTGLIDIVVCSDGLAVSNPKYLRKHQNKLSKLQRSLSRKPNKTSKRRVLAKMKLGLAHEKLKNIRNDFLQKISTTLVGDNQAIGIESLQIKNLQKNRRLSKSFADSGIHKLYTMLQYKVEHNGGHLVKVDKFFASTKTCSNCGYKKEAIKLSERTYSCEHCDLVISRDYNAALNIKSEAIKQLSATGHVVVRRGDTVSPHANEASSNEASRSSSL